MTLLDPFAALYGGYLTPVKPANGRETGAHVGAKTLRGVTSLPVKSTQTIKRLAA